MKEQLKAIQKLIEASMFGRSAWTQTEIEFREFMREKIVRLKNEPSR